MAVLPGVGYLQVGRLVNDPVPTGLRVLTLSFQPLFCGILPVYVLLLPTLPLVVWGWAAGSAGPRLAPTLLG